MKQSRILAMKARQRAERYREIKSGDIAELSTEDLRGFIAWVDYELTQVYGARYAHLDLLDDMAREELGRR